MKLFRTSLLSISLVAWLLFAGGVLTSLGASHILHHAHHQASTHATPLCSWMCAAGQATEIAEHLIDSPIAEIGAIDRFFSIPSLQCSIPPFFSRGAPVL